MINNKKIGKNKNKKIEIFNKFRSEVFYLFFIQPHNFFIRLILFLNFNKYFYSIMLTNEKMYKNVY